jgi:ribosomal protein L11 methyltransferase
MMPVPEKTWCSVSVVVKPNAVEAVEFAFNCLDSLGTEINDMPKADRDSVTVIGYFHEPPDNDHVQSELIQALNIYALPSDSVISVQTANVKNEDWLAKWKKHWKPTNIGRFVIAAPWHEVDDADKIVIRIEPNMAFGTGTHETTQLCLAAIDENYRAGQSFLDVGTGTGILAIAAAKLNSTIPISDLRFLACDTDEEAVAIARKNAELNGVSALIEFAARPISNEIRCFDFVCANLTADVIIPILSLLIEKTGETLVLSGILAEQEELILNAMPQDLKGKYEVVRSGEWVSVMIKVPLAQATR